MAYISIEAILEEGVDIKAGRFAPIDCVTSASSNYNCPVMLVRREEERFVALLRWLDRAIAKAWKKEINMEEVKG
jgi:hypothetical protein